jgi:hypothetical protein
VTDRTPGRRLADLTEAIKSANAGASLVTFDLVFEDDTTYRQVCEGGSIHSGLISTMYHVDQDMVAIYECDAVRTIKITIPRRSVLGGRDETDFDGTQQFAPLLDIEINID